MAYVQSSSAMTGRRGAVRFGLIGHLGDVIARRRLYSHTMAELRNLSDRELADLGISRLSIAQVAHEAAYGR
ncbi:DUF1127 domain-containing protein [Pseudogemmobacter sonorensis]|uniref:DUF1127 domain-containing protein n=1 Tax=Pseudogemmobacter sonorensis TaxID=2989681 RepID=UPI0036B84783